MVGYKSPHTSFTPPARLRAAFAGCELGAAPNWSNLAIYPGRVHRVRPDLIKPGGNVRQEDLVDYFRVLAGVDENVGRLLAELDTLGLANDTMVIYSSDNGYHFGDHGMGDKRSAYEESMRVPLLVRYPRRAAAPGTTIDAMVLNIDLAPTLLDFAGLPAERGMQGRSWRPLIEGRAQAIREQFLYEYFFYPDIADYELQTANPPITPTITALRTPATKLITYPGRTWLELFDLRSDPHEKRNLAYDPRHARLLADMQRRLGRELAAVGYRLPPGAVEPPLDGLEEWKR